MSSNKFCKNRIKPKLLREVKTEALLVFIRTTLEESFSHFEKNGSFFNLSNEEDTKEIHEQLNKLLLKLQSCVVNSSYLNTLINSMHRSKGLMLLAKKEEPLMVYYNSIVQGMEEKLTNGTKWIPELVVLSLLSEWLLEEEKSTFMYPFLKEIDYINLLEKYEKVRLDSSTQDKEIIMQMYKLSSHLITKLKNSTFKFKSRKKRR